MYTLEQIKKASRDSRLEIEFKSTIPFPTIWYANAIKDNKTPYVISDGDSIEMPKSNYVYTIIGLHQASGLVMFDKKGYSLYPWLISLDDLSAHGYYLSTEVASVLRPSANSSNSLLLL